MNPNPDQLTFDHVTTHRRHRIMLKLEALWSAYPEVTLGQLIWALPSEVGWDTSDDELERSLDYALTVAGATVPGGWRS